MASVFFKLTVNPMIETNALLLSHATIQKNITLNYDIYIITALSYKMQELHFPRSVNICKPA